MKPDELMAALGEIIPDDWQADWATCACHLEVWAIPPRNYGEWTIAVSHSGDWRCNAVVHGEWWARMEEANLRLWCDTPQEALEFVRVHIAEEVAAFNAYLASPSAQDLPE
jgi:hypothetical protein